MLKYSELFIDHLQKTNPTRTDFKVESSVDEDGNEAITRIKIPYGGTNITASFFEDKNGSHFSATMAIGMIAPNCVGLVTKDVIALCNEFNNKNQWVKFCIRDNNSVPGLNGALICLEESAILVEKTAASDAYSIISNLIKAHSESAEAFKKILNRSPAEKEEVKTNNKPVNISEKPKEPIKNTADEKPKEMIKKTTDEKTEEGVKGSYKNQNIRKSIWFPVIFSAISILSGIILAYALERLVYLFLGCVFSGYGLRMMLKQKEQRQTEFLKQYDIDWKLLNEQKNKESLPSLLTWILFILALLIFWLLSC